VAVLLLRGRAVVMWPCCCYVAVLLLCGRAVVTWPCCCYVAVLLLRGRAAVTWPCCCSSDCSVSLAALPYRKFPLMKSMESILIGSTAEAKPVKFVFGNRLKHQLCDSTGQQL